MGEFSSQIVGLFARAASAQGGIISGDNPTVYNSADPLRLWIIQLVIIIGVTQILGQIFARIRQPRVIAEVIGGVILGPSVMGHIPHFRNAIFPTASIPLLNLTANIGLVLFLFIVALEIDMRLLKRNVFAAASISIAGLIIPLGLGAALGVAVYREFVTDPNVSFGNFLLFVAVAIGITAFPVLCRILTELKLLDTEVGLVVLSAGVGNDVVGWILLALTVALVNASSGLTALWVLLACTGYVLVLLFPGRWAFRWLAIRTGSLERGSPTPFLMVVALLLVFISAFFTDIIGVHAIFGGFLAGLVIPHDNGLSLAVLEKIEDLVYVVFLPLYFASSGLNTNLSLLNNGITWGYVFLICTVAFFSKFIACGTTAYLNGFNWRESGAIGSLMSCKGLVELIVLNIGLAANILDPRTFSMFVIHAIFVTVMTTPLVLLFYPAQYRNHLLKKADAPQPKPLDDDIRTKFAILLDRMESLPSAMTLSQLLQAPVAHSSDRDSVNSSVDEKLANELSDTSSSSSSPIVIEALRLIELTNRTSTMIRSQEAEYLIHNDPVISTYRTFGQLNELSISAKVSVVNANEFPEAVVDHVSSTNSHMVIVLWPRGMTSATEEGNIGNIRTRNPFDGVFNKTVKTEDQTGAVVYSEFIRNVFAKSPSDVALFVDRGMINSYGGSNKQHLFLPFMGGPDDRLALSFLVQLCGRSSVTATVVKINKTDAALPSFVPKAAGEAESKVDDTVITDTAADTVYPQLNTQTRMTSGLADNLLWDRYSLPDAHHSPEVASAISRITFRVESTPAPLRHITELAKQAAIQSKQISDKTMIIIAGRSRRLAVESLRLELKKLTTDLGSTVSSSLPTTLGDVGAALVATNVNGSLLIVQAASPSNA